MRRMRAVVRRDLGQVYVGLGLRGVRSAPEEEIRWDQRLMRQSHGAIQTTGTLTPMRASAADAWDEEDMVAWWSIGNSDDGQADEGRVTDLSP